MAAPLNIVILGVAGVGKSTYLYRLVTAFLEKRGVSPADLGEMEPDAFLAAVENVGITYDTRDTADFLRHAHAQWRDNHALKSTSGDTMVLSRPVTKAAKHAPTSPSVNLTFPGVGLKFTAHNLSGDLVERAAHIAQGDTVGTTDERASQFLVELRNHLRQCDGVLFFHAPHQTRLEADSEMVLRQFSSMALTLNGNPFLPQLIVFTKADAWAGENPDDEVRDGQYAQGQAVANARERFVRAYWQALQEHHHVDLNHPYWQPISTLYRTGQNFSAVSGARGSFGELRGPIDQIARLRRASRQFYGNTRLRNFSLFMSGMLMLSVIAILAIVLPIFFVDAGTQRVTFDDPREVYMWLQDQTELPTLLAGLDGVRGKLIVEMETLRGATGSWTERSFSTLRSWVATLDSFERKDPAMRDHVMEVRRQIAVEVDQWLKRAADGATAPDQLPDAWLDTAERYVNGLGPFFDGKLPDFSRWRENWRHARYHRLKASLKEAKESVTEPQHYFRIVRALLEQFWRRYVDIEGSDATLFWLRLPRADARAEAIDAARRFAVLADDGNLPVAISVEKFVVPNVRQEIRTPRGTIEEIFPAGWMPTQIDLTAEGGKTNGTLTLTTTDSERQNPRTYWPPSTRDNIDDDASAVGQIAEFWRPGQTLSLVARATRGDSVRRTEIVYHFEIAARSGVAAPLPGYFIAAHHDLIGREGNTPASTGSRVLHFSVRGPELPQLLLAD